MGQQKRSKCNDHTSDPEKFTRSRLMSARRRSTTSDSTETYSDISEDDKSSHASTTSNSQENCEIALAFSDRDGFREDELYVEDNGLDSCTFSFFEPEKYPVEVNHLCSVALNDDLLYETGKFNFYAFRQERRCHKLTLTNQ